MISYIHTVRLVGLELLNADGGRFEINQLLFADDTALVAVSALFVGYVLKG